MRTRFLTASIVAGLAVVAIATSARLTATTPVEAIDQVFARWTDRTPGCAVGVASDGAITVERAYGRADLEHDVPNRPDTIFEAGSVSKQFTAAAMLLLARDGKLSLDDPVRKYVPELPDYGSPLTIRHMLNHTSGLRDWGSVAAIGGWPRTTRVHTHAHVLEIVSRQKSLNFPTGSRWSYSNTGYNLAAVIVARVSGQSFADFTRARIFEPLGMTRTSWRDDYTRIVKGRAIAYAESSGGFRMDMPFENVHGNGGLLTTVGDLLRWTGNFRTTKVGDAAFVSALQEPGRFNDGRPHDYALGLVIGDYKGLREVAHGGATAGYRAYLASYPERRLSVAVLCNVGVGDVPRYANAVTDIMLHSVSTAASSTARNTSPLAGDGMGSAPESTLSEGSLKAVVGTYRNSETGEPLTIARVGDQLRVGSNETLRAVSASRLAFGNGSMLDIETEGRLRMLDRFGTAVAFERVSNVPPAREALAAYEGSYRSDEAEVTLTAVLDSDALLLKRRPDSTIRLSPVYEDTFSSPLGLIRFRRNAAGRVDSLVVSQSRVWNLVFARTDDR